MQSQLTQARAQQVTIPYCASNYYTVTGGKLSGVARSSSAFRATQTETGTVRLPHSGTVNLKINRSGELGSDRSMEILEHRSRPFYMGNRYRCKATKSWILWIDWNTVGDFTANDCSSPDFSSQGNSHGNSRKIWTKTVLPILSDLTR